MFNAENTNHSILQMQKHYEKLQEDLNDGAPVNTIMHDVENLKGALSMLTLANDPTIPDGVKTAAAQLMSQMSEVQAPEDVTTYIDDVQKIMKGQVGF